MTQLSCHTEKLYVVFFLLKILTAWTNFKIMMNYSLQDIIFITIFYYLFLVIVILFLKEISSHTRCKQILCIRFILVYLLN